MSDNFWLQLFTFSGVVVVSVVAPIAIMYARVKLRIDKQFAEAKRERDSVINMVAGVQSKIVDAERAEELRFEETLRFQQKMLDSDVFAPGKLRAMAEKKRASGFGDLDP